MLCSRSLRRRHRRHHSRAAAADAAAAVPLLLLSHADTSPLCRSTMILLVCFAMATGISFCDTRLVLCYLDGISAIRSSQTQQQSEAGTNLAYFQPPWKSFCNYLFFANPLLHGYLQTLQWREASPLSRRHGYQQHRKLLVESRHTVRMRAIAPPPQADIQSSIAPQPRGGEYRISTEPSTESSPRDLPKATVFGV